MLIFFGFIYWFACWVTYLLVGSEVFFLVSCLHFLSPFYFLSTYFNSTPRFVFVVVFPVSIVTIIYVDLWSKSKFYWVLWLTIIKSVNYTFSNTYWFLFTSPWHFEMQICFLFACVIYKLLSFFAEKAIRIITTCL